MFDFLTTKGFLFLLLLINWKIVGESRGDFSRSGLSHIFCTCGEVSIVNDVRGLDGGDTDLKSLGIAFTSLIWSLTPIKNLSIIWSASS